MTSGILANKQPPFQQNTFLLSAHASSVQHADLRDIM